MKRFLKALPLLALLTACHSGLLFAQGPDRAMTRDHGDWDGLLGVFVGLRGGPVISNPRGTFPSIFIGSSAESTGEIRSEQARSSVGSRIGIAVMIPFSMQLGLSTEIGMMRYIANYEADTARMETTFQGQTLQLLVGLQGNIYYDWVAFENAGLRSIYIDGGLDITLATVANRIESSGRVEGGARIPMKGSFLTNEPFRNLVALRGALGTRYAVTHNLELQAEVGYDIALNPIFSGSVLPDSDFTVDHIDMLVGFGFRF